MIAIYNFLRKELKRFENKDIEDGRLRRISYRKAIINSSLRCEDAPIFVMKMVKNICMGENQEVTQDEICNTRLEVFNLLVAYSA